MTFDKKPVYMGRRLVKENLCLSNELPSLNLNPTGEVFLNDFNIMINGELWRVINTQIDENSTQFSNGRCYSFPNVIFIHVHPSTSDQKYFGALVHEISHALWYIKANIVSKVEDFSGSIGHEIVADHSRDVFNIFQVNKDLIVTKLEKAREIQSDIYFSCLDE